MVECGNNLKTGVTLLCLSIIIFMSGCDRHTKHEVSSFFPSDVPLPHEWMEGKGVPEGKYFLHGPYAARQCYLCHVKSPIRIHTSLLGLPAYEQCYQCHIQSSPLTDEKKPVSIFKFKVQPPGSFVLPLEDLCLECHPPKKISAAHWSQKGPVSDGNCIFCHDPHLAPFRYMLRKEN